VVECSADNSFIADTTRKTNFAAKKSSETLHAVWPEALISLQEHDHTLRNTGIVQRALNDAAARVALEPKHDNAFFLTTEGVQHVAKKLADAFDQHPLNLAKQVWDMHNQVRFLQERVKTDGEGPGQSKRDGHAVKELAKNTVAHFDSTLSPLSTVAGMVELVSRVTDESLVHSAPAPAQCKMMAFDEHEDPATASFIVLKNRSAKNNDMVLSQPMGALLELKNAFTFTLSKNMASQDVPAEFPVALLESVYTCARSKGEWKLQKATSLPESAGVTFCGGSSCLGHEDVRVAEVTEADSTHLKESALVESWGITKQHGL